MSEYFIKGTTFAAPFVSEDVSGFIEASDPSEALHTFVGKYKNGVGIYAAKAYTSADDYHKSKEPLATWLSNHEIAKRSATTGKGSYTYMGNGPGDFEIDGKQIHVDNPKDGSIV